MEAVNIAFVGEVEKYPELYDYTNSSYSRKDTTEKAWAAVGRKFNLTGQQSKEKWRNLRNSFVKNLKPAASGASARKKKTYYLSDAMKFALPFVKAQCMISGSLPEVPRADPLDFPQPSPENLNDEDGPAPSEYLELLISPKTLSPPPPPPQPLPPQPTTRSSSSSSSTPEPSHEVLRSVKRKRAASVNFDADKNMAAYFAAKKEYVEAKRKAAENVPQHSEAIKMFLLSIIPDLLALPPTEMRYFKRRTLDLIEDLLNAGTTEKLRPSIYHRPKPLLRQSLQTCFSVNVEPSSSQSQGLLEDQPHAIQ